MRGGLGSGSPEHGGGREEGERERRPRGSDSPTHLGLWWSVEGGRQWRAEVAGYGRGGGAADLGKERAVVEMVVVAESCAEALFIGRERRWRGALVAELGGH